MIEYEFCPITILWFSSIFVLQKFRCILNFIHTLKIFVRARTLASGLVGIHIVIVGIRLQTEFRVIVDVDVW